MASTTSQQHQDQGSSSLFDYPTTIICSNSKCAEVIVLPYSMWCWTCSKGHTDNIRNSACKVCHEPCPHNLPWPAVTCANCHTTTSVPSSEISALLKGGVYSFQSGINAIIEPPSTFHCSCCNTLLLVPRGSWKCQACEQVNTQKDEKCTKCAQDRMLQRVLCGQCGKSTSVPRSGLLDSLRAGLKELQQTLHRSWLDVNGNAHVDCPKCKNAVKIPSNLATNSTVITCDNCQAPFQVSPSTSQVINDSGNYVRLMHLNANPMNQSTAPPVSQTNEQFKLSDSLSKIDQTTSEFSKAPTVNPSNTFDNDVEAHKVVYEPTEKPDQAGRLNSLANTI